MDIVSCKLSEEAINSIAQVDSICNNVQDHERSNPLLFSLINDAKAEFESLVASQSINILYANMELSELNDFFEKSTEIATKKDIGVNKINDRKDSSIDDSDSIVEVCKDDGSKILPSGELIVKNENERELDAIIADWTKQITVSDRQNFITHLSANPKSILIFLSRIFVPWLKSEEFFSDAVETLVGIVGCLPQQAINAIFIPLCMEKECVLIREDRLQDLLVSMTDSQKNNLLCSYLDEIGTELQNNDVHILYKFIERTQLSVNSIKMLLEKLLTNLEHISSDRYLGNMLLHIAQQFSPNTPHEIIHLMAALCNQFKGVMRYRIKSILKTVTGDNDNSKTICD